MGKQGTEIFSSRERIRRWKSVAGVLHLVTVSSLVLSLLWILPRVAAKSPLLLGQEMQQQTERRQLLIEALDKMARYERYYNEIHGRFTRDISRLSIPEKLSAGKREFLEREYEISVLEARPNRFILLATGIHSSDRVTIDESHRLNANFVLPAPSRDYLFQEADRLLRLRAHGLPAEGGLFARYWDFATDEARDWVAVGVRTPVLGVKRGMEGEGNSLFSSVREQVQNRMGAESTREPAATKDPSRFKESLDARDVTEWLNSAHLAQHVHLREKGRFARRWEELDTVSDYHFSDRIRAVRNLRVHPIEMANGGYQLTLEGTSGDLLGEQFVMDQSGSVRQVRYTEALIQQLQETTNILENFQINPIVEDPANAEHP
jgi:hypothetical protein